MAGIFISYRREDSAGWTGRLAERLKQKFGAESIFMDIDTIQPGTDFTQALRSAVGACDVLLAMIGPEWSITRNAEGQLRLEDPNDWMRIELTTALSRNIPIIPVLVGGASLPNTSTLPDELKRLFHYQTHELTDKRWDYDSTQLIQVLEKLMRGANPQRILAGMPATRRATWVALGGMGVLLALASIQFFQESRDSQGNGSGPSPTRVNTSSTKSNAVDPVKKTSPDPPSTKRAETGNTIGNEPSTVSQREPESRITASSATAKSESRTASAGSETINLLSSENGGHIIVADNREWWPKTIDGDEKRWEYLGIGVDNHWVVYGFKDNRPATFDTFKTLILETDSKNLKEFELLSGNDSPTGTFEPIGKFQTQNIAFFDDPWQKFKFPAVKARYLKVKPISSYGFSSIAAYEFQLLGILEK